jgi:hypothetical protein
MNTIENNLKSVGWKFLFFLCIFVFLTFITPFYSRAQINFGDNPNFDPSGPGVKIIIVAPPEVFTLPESQTNITRVCTLGEALNIVLDVAGHNKIEFHEPIVDMCDNKTIENLDQYIQLDKTGEVTVDSNSLPYLEDKSATIVMRNLPFEGEPDIEVDGKPATNEDIENKSWDQSSNTLTFDAKHFTTYKAVAKFSESSPIASEEHIEEVRQQTSNIENIFLIIAIIITLLVVVGVLGYLIWRESQ